MEAFFIIGILSALLGGCIGWFSKGGMTKVLVLCAAASFALGATSALIMGGYPESFSPRYFLTGGIYYVFPYLIFLLAPALTGAALVIFVKRTKLRK